MGAKKTFDAVAGAELLTSPVVTAGVTAGGYRILKSDLTPKAKVKAFTTGNKILAIGDQLKVADLGIEVNMGSTGAGDNDEFTDATCMVGLDAMFASDDVIRFYAADLTTPINANLPDLATAVWNWNAAVAW